MSPGGDLEKALVMALEDWARLHGCMVASAADRAILTQGGNARYMCEQRASWAEMFRVIRLDEEAK